MRQYIVVAHRTLGGAHLLDHLKELAHGDPKCRFHVVVPRYHPRDQVWSDGTTQEFAQQHLDEMMELMASMGLTASGEVGSSNPVTALEEAISGHGADAFSGCVLSTLPPGKSLWWRSDVPTRIKKKFLSLPLTHLVGDGVDAA